MQKHTNKINSKEKCNLLTASCSILERVSTRINSKEKCNMERVILMRIVHNYIHGLTQKRNAIGPLFLHILWLSLALINSKEKCN